MKYFIEITEVNPGEVASFSIVSCKSEQEGKEIIEKNKVMSAYTEIHQIIITDKSKRK